MRAPRIPPEERPTVLEMYADGHSLKGIGRRYACGIDPVKRVLADAGIAIVPRQAHLRRSQLKKAMEFYAAGASMREIGNHFHCSPTTAWRALMAAGVKVRGRSKQMQMSVQKRHGDAIDRLIARRRIDEDTDCWVWTGALTANGHGALRIDGRHVHAHRLAYELTFGPVEPGKIVYHARCSNPACFNPAHTAKGTRADQARASVEMGRMSAGLKHSVAVRAANARKGKMRPLSPMLIGLL